MLLLSIEPLKASGTKGFKPGGRLSAWPAPATDSAYSALAVDIKIFYLNYRYIPLAP